MVNGIQITPLPGSVAINAGSTSGAGFYSADTDYSGNTQFTSTTAAINTNAVLDPAPQAVYQSVRFDPGMTYTIPNLNPGQLYNVRLDFAEIYYNAAVDREFNVLINDTQVLTEFDIWATARVKTPRLPRTSPPLRIPPARSSSCSPRISTTPWSMGSRLPQHPPSST